MLRELLVAWNLVQPAAHEQAARELRRARLALIEAEGRREEAIAAVSMYQSRARRLAGHFGTDHRLARRAALSLLEAEGRLEAEHAHCEMYRARMQRLERASLQGDATAVVIS